MIGRRKSPDGLPFRLYKSVGKRKVSYGYKMASGEWAFRLSASASDTTELRRIEAEAISRANELNGQAPDVGSFSNLRRKYFSWQRGLPEDSEDRKAEGTLKENEREAKMLDQVFGRMRPIAIKPVHVYRYLHTRAKGCMKGKDGKELKPAPAKANKEIALLSAILEYGRMIGEVETNPCRGIKYNKTRPRQKYTEQADIDYAVAEARARGGQYLVLALCVQVAYLTVSRPTEMRDLRRQAKSDAGLTVPVGKRKRGQPQKWKLIEWSPALKAAVDEALQLQRTASLYIFGNTEGQPYTRSGWNTIWTRLMRYCEQKAEKEGVDFQRFTLADMRPAAVTDRMEDGDARITDATGHADERMVKQVYDRRRTKKAKATK